MTPLKYLGGIDGVRISERSGWIYYKTLPMVPGGKIAQTWLCGIGITNYCYLNPNSLLLTYYSSSQY